MSEKQQLVDDLIKMVENKIMIEMVVAKMTYDTAPHVTAVEQADKFLRQNQPGFGDPIGEAREKARSAIRDWVDVVDDRTSRSEEP